MKRLMSVCVLVLALCLLVSPALAEGSSMTDPVEVIGTVPGTEPPTPPEDTTKSPTPENPTVEELLELWGITDPDVPLAFYNNNESGQGWALLNLISAVLSTGFGAAATVGAFKVKKAKTELTDGDKKLTLVKKEKTRTVDGAKVTETGFIQKSPLWKAGYYDLISSAASIGTFVVTENMLSRMYMADRWTPLMAGILAVSVAGSALTNGGKKLDGVKADQLLAATAASGADSGKA